MASGAFPVAFRSKASIKQASARSRPGAERTAAAPFSLFQIDLSRSAAFQIDSH
jgi:hypothetical protein